MNRVAIGNEDNCDSCKRGDRIGVCFGFSKPVICIDCLEAAVEEVRNGDKPVVSLTETMRRVIGALGKPPTRH